MATLVGKAAPTGQERLRERDRGKALAGKSTWNRWELTPMAPAQCGTIRRKLLKIGAQIRVTVRKVYVALAEGCPYAAVFRQVYQNLLAR